MPENFIRPNSRSLEAAIAACTDARDLQNLLAEASIIDVIQGRPQREPDPKYPVGTRLRAKVQAPDGRFIEVCADSYAGLDVLADGVKRGQITKDIK